MTAQGELVSYDIACISTPALYDRTLLVALTTICILLIIPALKPHGRSQTAGIMAATFFRKSEAISRGARMLRTALGPAIATWLEEPAIAEVMLNPDGRLWVRSAY